MSNIESNKLIAEFMGYKYFPFDESKKVHVMDDVYVDQMNGWHKPTPGHYKIQNWYLCRTHKDLAYHYKWDWLMPVCEKIIRIGNIDFVISLGGSTCISFDDGVVYYNFIKGRGRGTIETVYEAVVDFINWYNNNHVPAENN